MKDIMLKITGIQTGYDGEEETLEFITEGKLYERNGAHYILYDESEVSGMEGCKTTLKYTDSLLRMKRTGEEMGKYTVIEFGQNHRYTSSYFTPYGPIDMEVNTHVFENHFDEEGLGSLFVDYDVTLTGLGESRNKLNMRVANSLAELNQEEDKIN